jgi:predicted anti-sigma-YlaC factor YlaD
MTNEFLNRDDFGFKDGHIYGFEEATLTYLGGRLSEGEMDVIDAHLMKCRACQSPWDAWVREYENPQVESEEGEDR